MPVDSQTKRSEENVAKQPWIARITAMHSRLGTNHQENIQRITSLCGELLGASCALYNRLEGALLCSAGTWMAPADYNPKDTPDGHICYDVIRNGSESVLVIRDLPKTTYGKTDPNVRKYGLQTYVGKAVRFGGMYLGSLCAVFSKDRELTADEIHQIELLAALLGSEEDRRREYERLLTIEQRYNSFVENVDDAICRWVPSLVLTYTNSRYNTLFSPNGLSLVGKRWIEFVPKDQRVKTAKFYQELATTPHVVNFEHQITLCDGKEEWFRWIDIPLFHTDGTLYEFQSIGRPIPAPSKDDEPKKASPKRHG